LIFNCDVREGKEEKGGGGEFPAVGEEGQRAKKKGNRDDLSGEFEKPKKGTAGRGCESNYRR